MHQITLLLRNLELQLPIYHIISIEDEMDIIIYTGPMCPYCEKAKALLQSKSLDYQEIYVGDNPDLVVEMIEKANGKRSSPSDFFIKDTHVSGYDDLYEIDRSDLEKHHD